MSGWRKDMAQTLLERSRRAPSGCIEWTGTKSAIGYGVIMRGRRPNRKTYVAHRVAYALAKGTIPEGLKVCHTCDNRLCVNPDHLWVGSQAENMADMKAKGRDNRGCGGRPYTFTPEFMGQIVAELKAGGDSKVIAERIGVHRSTVLRWRQMSQPEQ